MFENAIDRAHDPSLCVHPRFQISAEFVLLSFGDFISLSANSLKRDFAIRVIIYILT